MRHGIVESAEFVRQAESIFTQRELFSLQLALMNNPTLGVVIPGTRGLRKVRWGAGSSGKRGGARVIYFWRSYSGEIQLLAAYEKRSRANLSRVELLRLRASIDTD